MSDSRREQLAAGRTLSEASRELALIVHRRELAAADIAAAAVALRELAATLDGPERPKWWEHRDAELETVVPGYHYRHHSPFGGDLHLFAPGSRWEQRRGPAGQPGLCLRVTLDDLHGGPPGHAHGGVLAGFFDEALGACMGLLDDAGAYTGKLSVRYRALTPLDRELELAAWIHSERDRRIVARATCHAGDELTAEAEGLFVRPVADG